MTRQHGSRLIQINMRMITAPNHPPHPIYPEAGSDHRTYQEAGVVTSWITAEAAAERLGVKRATLYAYVSRGLLVRKRAPDGRTSLFDPREIDKLTARGRPRHQPAGAELVIESALTDITGD